LYEVVMMIMPWTPQYMRSDLLALLHDDAMPGPQTRKSRPR
jgi:hypothetical protein